MPETRDMKTVKWVDAKGKTRVYEPTKRKERIRQGKYSDANDYRNTEAYIQSENYKKTNRETIKSDIDKLLPEAKSYEDLLFLLRRNGYIIKDKKVNGDWLKYITYKTASQESGTRDYKLGEDYTRENLTARIKNKIRDIIAGYEMNLQKNTDTVFNTVLIKPEQIQSDQARSESNESDKIPYNIDEINDKYRIINDKNKGITFEKIPRGEVEQYIINDVKKLHDNIQQIYDNQKDTLQPEKPEPVLNNRRSQYYLDRINANLKTLKFVEEKHIHSFEQINSVVTALYEKKKQAQSELTKIKNTLEKAGETVIAINTMNQIKDRIKKQQQTNGYKKEEIDAEGEFLKNYEDNLRKQNLGEREKQEKFVLNYNRFHASYEKLAESLTAVNEQIREYDDCVRTLNYIDKENSKKYTAEVQEYYDIKTRQERD